MQAKFIINTVEYGVKTKSTRSAVVGALLHGTICFFFNSVLKPVTLLMELHIQSNRKVLLMPDKKNNFR